MIVQTKCELQHDWVASCTGDNVIADSIWLCLGKPSRKSEEWIEWSPTRYVEVDVYAAIMPKEEVPY
tara:strand:- start:650 stop:850 length:201 start_codon:yes stop_codon:yes gene_type:complete